MNKVIGKEVGWKDIYIVYCLVGLWVVSLEGSVGWRGVLVMGSKKFVLLLKDF